MIIDLKDFDSFYKQLNEAEKAKIIYFDSEDASFVKKSWNELRVNIDRLNYVTEAFQQENKQVAELVMYICSLIEDVEYYRKRSLSWKQKKHKLNIWRI